MTVSDVLFEAARDIRSYLDEFPEMYAGPLRERLERLVAEMDAIRELPGMDSPPG